MGGFSTVGGVEPSAVPDTLIQLFKSYDSRVAYIFPMSEYLYNTGKVTIDEVAKYANDILTVDSAAFHLQSFSSDFSARILNSDFFSVSKAQNVIISKSLSSDKAQSILYSMIGIGLSKLIDIITYGASNLTVSSNTTISGVNRYGTLTVNSGYTLTIDGQPGVIVANTLNNYGTITKTITGASGGAGAQYAGSGGRGGGGLIIFVKNLTNTNIIGADGANGGSGSTGASYSNGSAGSSGAFYRTDTDLPGNGGNGGYAAYCGVGNRNGGGGGGTGEPGYYGGNGGSSTITSMTSTALAETIAKSLIDWIMVNVFGKNPTTTTSIPNVYGSGGGGGASASTGNCGGGGGGGGQILVFCSVLNNTGTIRANGGNGGNGGSQGSYDTGGGGGGGGMVYIFYKSLTNTGTLSASGGSGGSGDLSGYSGSAGTARAIAV